MAIQFGHVYFLRLPLAGKEKLVVPLFVQDGRVRYFVINSERTDFQARSPEISKHVLPLAAVDNGAFLKHDSWLTCHELVGGPSEAEINATKNCYRGPLDARSSASIKALIQESRLHSSADKAAILAAWP